MKCSYDSGVYQNNIIMNYMSQKIMLTHLVFFPLRRDGGEVLIRDDCSTLYKDITYLFVWLKNLK